MTDKEKLNCWEYMKCERQPGGARVSELGPCDAVSNEALHGFNGGSCGGRACWVIPGTLCSGIVCGSFDEKYTHCRFCDFFAMVQVEEGAGYVDHVELLVALARHDEESSPAD